MLAFSEIVDFLLNLMRDENARAEFEQDPQGTLAAAGLEGVTGQDISDARLQLADSGAVRPTDDGGSAGSSYQDDPDPVRQIGFTTQQFRAEDPDPVDDNAGGGAAEPGTPASSNSFSIDDRDSFFFQTFTSDNDVTIIDDSFNTIDNSSTDVAVTNIDAQNSFNDVTAIDADNSFNTTEDNDVLAIQDNDTVNQDTDVLVVDAENSFNDAPAGAAPPAPEPAVADPVAATPPAAEPAAAEQAATEPALEEPAPEEPAIEEPAFEEPADEPIDDQAGDLPIDEPIDEPIDDPIDDPADIVSA